MKFFLLLIIFSLNAYSTDCSVFGISDSPQKMNCYIHESAGLESLSLTCKDDVYQIFWKNKTIEIDQAFHEEVESGSSPLVFQSSHFTLKTVSLQIYAQAKLFVGTRSYEGICFFN